MHGLAAIVELNERAHEQCALCKEYRLRVDARGGFIATYEVFNAETSAEVLLCNTCVRERTECGEALKRVQA